MFSRLSLNRDFQTVYRHGSCLRTHFYNLYFRSNLLGKNRLGVIASKKTGNAVQRNRAKRLLREAIRRLSRDCLEGFDLIISAKSTMIGTKINDILEALKNSLIKTRIYIEKQ